MQGAKQAGVVAVVAMCEHRSAKAGLFFEAEVVHCFVSVAFDEFNRFGPH